MIDKLRVLIVKLFHNEGFLYLLVGGTNTLASWVLTYLLTQFLHTGYWLTSAITFAIGGTYSYLLNRKYTFNASELPHSRTLPRFTINLLICYFISYISAKQLLDYMFANVWQVSWSDDVVTLIKLLSANVLYIVINYLGQKFFAFKKKSDVDDVNNQNVIGS
ncbi:MAG: GtrA family protein [Oscillospiraceae bacterium]